MVIRLHDGDLHAAGKGEGPLASVTLDQAIQVGELLKHLVCLTWERLRSPKSLGKPFCQYRE